MQIDLWRTEQHVSVLREELREVRILTDLVSSWMSFAILDPASDVEALRRQLTFLDWEARRIQARIDGLGSVIELFRDLTKENRALLEDAVQELRRLED